MLNYRFQNIQNDITNATIEKNLINNKINTIYEEQNKSIGGKYNINGYKSDPTTINNKITDKIFDVNVFNKNIDKLYSNIQQRQKIEDKIKDLKLKSKLPNPDEMTISQFIKAIILDTYDTFIELSNIKKYSKSKINHIFDKNYRTITIYIILLIFFIAIYHILSIKSYLFSDVLNN